MKPARDAMRRHEGHVDVCIVGAGAAGSVLAKELAEGGMSVVVLEAGPWLDTVADFSNDELSMLGKVDWDDLRITDGENPLQMGRTNTGRGVGGSTIHFTAMKLRMQPDDFHLRTREGLADDWPITYDQLAPYYDKAEHFLAISGPRDFPWGRYPGPFPQAELPMNAADEYLAEGYEKAGFQWRMTPHAVLTGAVEGRSPCMFYGFCVNGCKSDAKGSALVTWIPHAVKAGAEIRENCFVTRLNLGSSGRVASVTYSQDGRELEQTADRIILSCYSIETPRLLLNSASADFPDGLANRSGLVGKNLMVHPAVDMFGHFPSPLDNFVTPPVGIMSLDHHGTQPGRDYVRGFLTNRYSHFPIEFASSLIGANPDLWGSELMAVLDEYPFYCSLTSQNEMLPRESNQVTLADETDAFGLPVAKVTMSYDENDRRMLADSERVCREILELAGADRIIRCEGAYHLLGTCRMGKDPERSVVDEFCRSHDIPNLYICDGSVFVTEGCVNPSLTIEAIALRTAEAILAGRN